MKKRNGNFCLKWVGGKKKEKKKNCVGILTTTTIKVELCWPCFLCSLQNSQIKSLFLTCNIETQSCIFHAQRSLMLFWSDCWWFYCILFRIGDYTSTSRCSSLIRWKGIWADRAGITFGCFWIGCYYGSKSPWGINSIFSLLSEFCVLQVLAVSSVICGIWWWPFQRFPDEFEWFIYN